jgi:hypothetical protein
LKTTRVIVFSSVQMEYVAKMPKLIELPVEQVYSLTEQEYRRLAAGTGLVRVRLRLAMYVGYPLRVLWAALRAPGSTALLVSSNTFFAPLLAWLGSRAGRPAVIHWRCDLYPDALVVAGTIPAGSLVERVIGGVQRWMNRTCDQVVSVGDFLQEHAEARWGRPRGRHCIDNVPSDETKFAPRLGASAGSLGFHYGGQLGYMHEPESLAAFVRAARRLGGPAVRFDFRMSGAYRAQFVALVRDLGLEVQGPVANAEWKVLIEDFQIGLVSLSPGGATVSLPSKIYSMMAGGLAIVAVCPAWSDLARIIRDTECGWVVNNSPFTTVAELQVGDYRANCEARRAPDEVAADSERLVAELLAQPERVEACRQKAVQASHATYGVAELRRRWARVFADLPSAR